MNKQKGKPLGSMLSALIGLSGQRWLIERVRLHSVLDGSQFVVLLMVPPLNRRRCCLPRPLLEDD